MSIGVTPPEGEAYIASKIYVNSDLELMLITAIAGWDGTDAGLASVAWADLTERAATFSYARSTLASWTTGSNSTHPQVVFTPSGGAWTDIIGAVIKPVASNDILHIQVDDARPVNVPDGTPYRVDISQIIA